MGLPLEKREDLDFAILEGEYRAGAKSLHQLAEEYKIARESLRMLAKEHGWTRDLQPAIKERTATLLRQVDENESHLPSSVWVDDNDSHSHKKTIHLAGQKPSRINEAEVIEAVAQGNAAVIRKGQKRIARLQGVVEGMIEELASQSLSADQLQHMSEFVAMVDGQMTEDKVSAKEVNTRVSAFKKILQLDGRADTAAKLATSLKTLIGLERQAHGIADNANGDADGGDKNKDVDLTVNEAARRVAFVLLSASKNKEGTAT